MMARCRGLEEENRIKPLEEPQDGPRTARGRPGVGPRTARGRPEDGPRSAGSGKDSRVSVSVLDAAQVSLDGQEDACVSGAAVLQQGSGGLPGALSDFAVEGGGCKRHRWRFG